MSNEGERPEAPDDAPPEQDRPSAPADASDSVPEDVSGDGAPEEGSGDDVAADLDAFVTLAAERDEYLDALRRTQADFENYRKRVQREMSEARDAGAASLAGRLIEVLDTVELALAHDPSDSVAQIATALFDSLGKEGLTRIDALGAAFDPEVHDAVLHEEGDGTAEVIEVLRSGWTWNGRVVRPAMVKVKGS
ncbi:MAG TPA: nucleotide exchange factor GrpE [Acidimicrobiales bacterium]|nr:nucleotide exchange factor GrpE [Acidimicrobiales bacterium]